MNNATWDTAGAFFSENRPLKMMGVRERDGREAQRNRQLGELGCVSRNKHYPPKQHQQPTTTTTKNSAAKKNRKEKKKSVPS